MPYLITKYDDLYHLRFKDTVMVNGVQMEQEFYFNEAEETFHGMTNAANTIRCYPAYNFFIDAINGSHRWKTSVAAEKSDDFKTALQAMITEMATGSTKYEISGNTDADKAFTLRKVDGEFQLSFTMKFRRAGKDYTVELPFSYDMQTTNEGITLSYKDARTDGAQSVLNSFPSVKAFLESFNGSYTIVGRDNSYSLRNVRLTSTTKSDSWIVFQYEN